MMGQILFKMDFSSPIIFQTLCSVLTFLFKKCYSTSGLGFLVGRFRNAELELDKSDKADKGKQCD